MNTAILVIFLRFIFIGIYSYVIICRINRYVVRVSMHLLSLSLFMHMSRYHKVLDGFR